MLETKLNEFMIEILAHIISLNSSSHRTNSIESSTSGWAFILTVLNSKWRQNQVSVEYKQNQSTGLYKKTVYRPSLLCFCETKSFFIIIFVV